MTPIIKREKKRGTEKGRIVGKVNDTRDSFQKVKGMCCLLKNLKWQSVLGYKRNKTHQGVLLGGWLVWDGGWTP